MDNNVTKKNVKRMKGYSKGIFTSRLICNEWQKDVKSKPELLIIDNCVTNNHMLIINIIVCFH